jgi:L-asparaginase II
VRFARVRSGLEESSDEVEAIALDASGRVLFTSGDPDRPLYYRSAIKPFQALAGVRAGLRLPAEHLAITCSSHTGYPVHIGLVRQILADAGLSSADLKCASDRPGSSVADHALVARGNARYQRIFHNCSGKHAGWLAACAVAGWGFETYLEDSHPVQISIREIVREFTGIDPQPVGIDGCGAPASRGTIRGIAKAFTLLDTEEELRPIADALTRFGSLTSDNITGAGRFAAVWGGRQKGGAEGSFVAVRHGVAIATKSRSGNSDAAVAGALHVADTLGMLTDGMRDTLAPQINPPVLGGGAIVGRLELVG